MLLRNRNKGFSLGFKRTVEFVTFPPFKVGTQTLDLFNTLEIDNDLLFLALLMIPLFYSHTRFGLTSWYVYFETQLHKFINVVLLYGIIISCYDRVR